MNAVATEKRSAGKLKLTADGLQNLTILAIFVIICIVGYILKPDLFLTTNNMVNILVSASSTIITASAVTMVLISGNLDLSVGGVGAMAGVLFGLFAKAGVPVLTSAVLAVLAGMICGCLSGLIISALSLPSFIISLAFKYIASGIALIGAGGAIISAGLPGNIGMLGRTISGIPLPVVYAIVIFLIFLFIQNKTVFASQAYAIGSNITTAKLSGINTTKVVTILTKVETLNEISRAVPIPLVAIGGLNAGNLGILKGAGMSGIAVVSAIMKSETPRETAAELKQLSLQLRAPLGETAR